MDRLLTDCENCGFHATWEICAGCSSNAVQAFDTKTLKAVGEWGDEDCHHIYDPPFNKKRHECYYCWEELKQGKMPE